MLFFPGRKAILIASVSAVAAVSALPAQAQVRRFDVPAQAAQSGVLQLGQQAGVQILASQDDLAGVRINAVQGDLDVRAAVRLALQGTGLRIVSDDGRTLLLGRGDQQEAGAVTVEDVVVTGVARATDKFRTSYAISSISEEQVTRQAPMNTADLIGRLPGFYAEASGGESNNNISPRGLPGSFGTRFISIQEDGMTFFQDPNEIYLNGDSFLRSDIMVERVEAVRSGPAPIFASNAPAGLINTITRKGTDTAEAAVRLTLQNTGMQRLDGYWSGPLGGDWYLAAGGFWRVHDGYRDPGFPADKGGQFRINLTKRFEGGDFTAYAKVIDETNIFYLPIPLKDPRDGSSLADLVDPHTGTLISNANRRYVLRTFTGADVDDLDRDIADGRHAKAFMAGFDFRRDFGDGWTINNRFRYFDASVNLDTMFTTTAPQDADQYLAARLTKARTAFGAGVDRLQFVVADERGPNGARVAWDAAATRNLVIESSYRYVPTEGRTVSDELQITRTLSGFGPGEHDLTVGGGFSYAELSHARLLQDGVHELNSDARRLDILALDAAGEILGSLTDNGFHRYGSYFIRGEAESKQTSFYIADSWRLNERLTIDAGYRRQWYDQTGVRQLTETRNLGDLGTTADDSVQGDSGRTQTFEMKRDNTAWTVGANYEVTPTFAVFGRYTNAFRGQNLWAAVTNTQAPDDKITGYEMGLKYNTRPLQLFATLFYTDFDRLSVSGPTVNPNTGVNESTTYWGVAESKGVETEFAWRPNAWFSLEGNVTWQQPRQSDLQESKYGALGDAYNDKLPPRVPEWLARVEPTIHTTVAGYPVSMFTRASYVGERFVDSLNSTRLPAYTTVDAGIAVDFDQLSLQLTGSNILDEFGLTEGNPRVDSLTGQGTDEAMFGRPIFARHFRLVATYRW